MQKGLLIFCIFCLLLPGLSCGRKAPPQPRETVVPGPVRDLSIELDPKGPRVTFKLPSVSLDGTPLKRIGGYRVLREGPEGKRVLEEVIFSVSEQTGMVGKQGSFVDTEAAGAGEYRYCVVPFDPYGSHPEQHAWKTVRWQGAPPGGNPETVPDHPK